MKYAVVDPSNGQIKWTGVCPDADFASQGQHIGLGYVAKDISSIEPENNHVNGNNYYYDAVAGQVKARENAPATIPATATVGTPVTITVPSGAKLFIDGNDNGIVPTGSENLTFSDAGTYKLVVSLWPYFDTTFEVVVS